MRGPATGPEAQRGDPAPWADASSSLGLANRPGQAVCGGRRVAAAGSLPWTAQPYMASMAPACSRSIAWRLIFMVGVSSPASTLNEFAKRWNRLICSTLA